MSWTLELGYIRDGVETYFSKTNFDGLPRKGAGKTITAADGISHEYTKVGISHLVQRVTVHGEVPLFEARELV